MWTDMKNKSMSYIALNFLSKLWFDPPANFSWRNKLPPGMYFFNPFLVRTVSVPVLAEKCWLNVAKQRLFLILKLRAMLTWHWLKASKTSRKNVYGYAAKVGSRQELAHMSSELGQIHAYWRYTHSWFTIGRPNITENQSGLVDNK